MEKPGNHFSIVCSYLELLPFAFIISLRAWFSSEKRGIKLPKPVTEIQPKKLRITQTVRILDEIYRLGMLTTCFTSENITNAERNRSATVFQELIPDGSIHFQLRADISLSSSLRTAPASSATTLAT